MRFINYIVPFLFFLVSVNGYAQYCDEAQGTPGFPSDPTCEAAVCANDAWCCDNTWTWDAVCASYAATSPSCTGCLAPPPPPSTCIHGGNFGTSAIPADGSTTINVGIWAGEYTTFTNTINGATHHFSSSEGTDWLVLTDGANNILAQGNSPISWTATFSGTVRVHVSTNSSCGTSATGRSISAYAVLDADYQATWLSMDVGQTIWCLGETRDVEVTIQNTGDQPWYADPAHPDRIALSYKWNSDANFDSYSNNRNLLPNDVPPGGTVTVTIPVQSPNSGAGLNNITFNIIRGEVCWFTYNDGNCGPGNTTYSSVDINVNEVTGNPSAFGNNTWHVYGFDGRNRDNLGALEYRGYYTQDLGAQQGFNTQAAWGATLSPSFAPGYQGCDIPVDYHTVVHKRQGFAEGTYNISIDNWDDESVMFIDGIEVWSADFWSGNSAGNGFDAPYLISCINLDASSTIEFRNAEGTGSSNAQISLTMVDPEIQDVIGATFCASSVTLHAEECGEGTVYWYANPDDCEPIGVGNSYTTPWLDEDATYWTSVTSGDVYEDHLATNLAGTFYGYAGQMFNVEANDEYTVEVKAVKIRPDYSTNHALRVYYRPEPLPGGTYPIGLLNTGWTQVYNGTYSGTQNTLSPWITLDSKITIPAGCTYSIYIYYPLRYRGNSTAADDRSNAHLTIFGEGYGAASSTTEFNMAAGGPRGFRGELQYDYMDVSERVPVEATIAELPQVPTVYTDDIACFGNSVELHAKGLAPGGKVANFPPGNTDVKAGTSHTGVTNDFTLEFWAKPTQTRPVTSEVNTGNVGTSGHSFAIAPIHGGTNDAGIGVSFGTNGVSVFEHGDAHFPSVLVSNMDILDWVHVAVVYENKIPKLYINSVYVKTGLESLRDNVFTTSTVGHGYGHYEGLIDNIRIWSRPLTQTEIAENMYLEESNVDPADLVELVTFNNEATDPEYYTYAWSNGPSLPPPSIDEVQSTGIITAGGTHIYNVTAQINTCVSPISVDVEVDLPNQSNVLSLDGQLATCTVNDNNYVHFYHRTSGRLLASINSNGQNLGEVDVTSFVDGASIPVQACGTTQPQFVTMAMGRRWNVTPEFQPTTDVNVRLYFDQSELGTLMTESQANTDNPNDDVGGIWDLQLSKFSGDPTVINGDFPDNCGMGATTLHGQIANGNVTDVITGFDTGGRYVEFTVPSFSELWLHNTDTDPLPVELTSFDAICEQSKVAILWTTQSEQMSDYYEVQRSVDMNSWKTIKTVPAAGYSTSTLDYRVEDASPISGLAYYRLVQYDTNGEYEVFHPVSIQCESQGSLSVYPNPTSGEFTIAVLSDLDTDKAVVEITDLLGKHVAVNQVALHSGMNYFDYNATRFNMGTYIIRVHAGDFMFNPIRLVVTR